MKSRTKNLLTEQQITRLVKANFGQEIEIGRIDELKGGMFNSAYWIDLPELQNAIVLKVSLTPDTPVLTYEKDLMPTEVEVMQLITDKTTIPIPKVLGFDFSNQLINSNYFFMTAMHGQVMTSLVRRMGKENNQRVKMTLGGYFAQIHGIKGKYFGYFSKLPKRQFQTWREAFLDMNATILRDAQQHHVDLPYARIESVLAKHAHLLDEVSVPSLVHYDIWPGNIFMIKNGDEYQIEGIVDFERAFWGDPYADFVSMSMLQKEIWKDSHFWQGYCATLGTQKVITAEDEIRITMYHLYIWIIMVTEVFRYGFLYGTLQRTFSKRLMLKSLVELEAA